MVFAPRSRNIGNLIQGVHPKVRVGYGWGAVFSRKPAISLKRGKTGPRLLLITNRKSHTSFRLVPNGHYALCFKTHASFGAHHANLNYDRPILSYCFYRALHVVLARFCYRRCSPTTLDTGNIRFMRIFAGFPGEGASNDSGAIKNIDFQGFQMLRLQHLRNEANIIIQYDLVHCRLSTDHKIHDLE